MNVTKMIEDLGLNDINNLSCENCVYFVKASKADNNGCEVLKSFGNHFNETFICEKWELQQ